MLTNGTNQGATRLDPRAALDMQKLLPCIQQSDPAAIKQHQRHIEDCLARLLLSGVPPPVSLIGLTFVSISSLYVCTSVHQRSIRPSQPCLCGTVQRRMLLESVCTGSPPSVTRLIASRYSEHLATQRSRASKVAGHDVCLDCCCVTVIQTTSKTRTPTSRGAAARIRPCRSA